MSEIKPMTNEEIAEAEAAAAEFAKRGIKVEMTDDCNPFSKLRMEQAMRSQELARAGWPRALAEIRLLTKRIERAQGSIGVLRGRGIGYADDVLDEVEEALEGAFDEED